MDLSKYYSRVTDFLPPSAGEATSTVTKAAIAEILARPQKPSVFQPAVNFSHGIRRFFTGNGRSLDLPANSQVEAGEYNFREVDKVMRIEAFVMRAFQMLTSLSVGGSAKNKYGFHLESANPEAKAYITNRLEALTFAIGGEGSVYQFVRKILDNVVRKSNAIIWLRRKVGTEGRYEYLGRQRNAIVGLEVIDPSQVNVVRETTDRVVLGFDLETASDSVFIPLKDCKHIAYNKVTEDDLFGCPVILPVLDDILSLRRLEEMLDLAMGKSTFPMYHIAIGDEKHDPLVFGNRGEDNEVQRVRALFEDMAPEGIYVSPGHHKVSVVQPRVAADFQPYLEWYRDRVFSGLMVDGATMGIGSTANRNTANVMNQNMINKVKDIQLEVSSAITRTLIRELLVEGGFSPIGQDAVYFMFDEIDLRALMDYENHIVQMYQGSIYTHEEARQSIGREPVTDQSQLFMDKAAELEVQLLKAKGAVNPTLNRPQNQHGKSSSRPSAARKKDLSEAYRLYDRVRNQTSGLVSKLGKLSTKPAIKKQLIAVFESLLPVYGLVNKDGLLEKAVDNLINSIFDKCQPITNQEKIRNIFDSNRYRIEAIFDLIEESNDPIRQLPAENTGESETIDPKGQ